MTLMDRDQLHTNALIINHSDRRAIRDFRSASTTDLRQWLGNAPIAQGAIDDWTLARRVRLMQAELSTRISGPFFIDNLLMMMGNVREMVANRARVMTDAAINHEISSLDMRLTQRVFRPQHVADQCRMDAREACLDVLHGRAVKLAAAEEAVRNAAIEADAIDSGDVAPR